MTHPTPAPRDDDALPLQRSMLIWWIVWAAPLLGLIAINSMIHPTPAPDLVKNPLPHLVGLVPLALSIIIRWLVLPRSNEVRRTFVLFVLGVALAEGCGLLGVFMGGVYRNDLLALGLLGIGQFVPFFARRLIKS